MKTTIIDWLTPNQVAPKIGLHPDNVRRALEHGDLHGHQKCRGGRWSINPAAVDAYMKDLDQVVACGCARLRSVGRRAA